MIIMAVSLILLNITLSADSLKLSGQAKSDLRSANMYRNQGIFDKALHYYNAVLETEPTHIEALENSAGINFDINNDYFKAHSLYVRAIDSVKEILSEYNTLQQQDEREAEKFYKKTIKKYDLEAKLENLLKLRDSCWIKIYNSGQNLFKNEQYEQALETFENLLTIGPDSVKTLKMLAYIHYNLGNLEESSALEMKVAALDPTDEIVRQKIASTFFEKQDFASAAIWFQEAINANPENPDNYFNLGLVYDNLEDTENALIAMEQSLELDPENLDAVLMASNYALALKDLPKQIVFLKKAVALSPENIDYLSFLSYILVQDKKYDEMLEYAMQWHELDPNSKEAIQLIYQGAKETGDKELEKKFEAILRNMK